jgi:hypothetical protein
MALASYNEKMDSLQFKYCGDCHYLSSRGLHSSNHEFIFDITHMKSPPPEGEKAGYFVNLPLLLDYYYLMQKDVHDLMDIYIDLVHSRVNESMDKTYPLCFGFCFVFLIFTIWLLYLARRMTRGYLADVFFMKQFISKQNPAMMHEIRRLLSIL